MSGTTPGGPAGVPLGVPGRDFGVKDVRGEFPERIEVPPLERPPDATVRVPGSKSVTNRALVIAALAEGRTTLLNPLLSDDSFWLMKSLSDLGFPVEVVEGGHVTVGGGAGKIPRPSGEVFVGNAGTAARFLPGALTLGEGPYRIDGVPRMRERPISDLVDALGQLGARIEYAGEEGRFPLVVRGGLRGGRAVVRSAKSSQFLSGVLISAPAAREPVTLAVEGDLVSKPYVGITTAVMRAFGVEVGRPSEGEFYVEPATYRATDYAVEPDASGASYFFAAAALTGGRVRVEGLGQGSSQGDLRFTEVLRRMGCSVEVAEGYTEVRGPENGDLKGVAVDMNEISDTFITLAALAPFASSPTTITGIEHTRYQETDRIHAVATELERLGVEARESRDGIHIIPGPVRAAEIETYEDHRIAMSFALVGLVRPGIGIKDPACVTKTLPDYFRRLAALGGG